MFALDKDKIGEYVGHLIHEKGWSDRQFAIKCLEKKGWKDDGSVEYKQSLQNLQNRICSIKKGRKWIQVEDLPLFSELLDLSIESILSAGTILTPSVSRLTNYSVALSKDPEVWKEYIENKDGAFLNYDEYGKSIIDYALQYKNYALLKYLVEEKVIWFVGDDKSNYPYRFGAGTSIKRRVSTDQFTWEYDIKTEDSLRTDLASLAIENKDFKMLDELHARETPQLYYGAPNIPDINPENFLNKKMIEAVAGSGKDVLKYFTESFSVDDATAPDNHYIFPYVHVLVGELIKRKSKYLKEVLSRIEEHNKTTLDVLEKMISEETAACREKLTDRFGEENLRSIATQAFHISSDKESVRYTAYETNKSYAARIVRIDDRTGNKECDDIIDSINAMFEKIVGYGGK